MELRAVRRGRLAGELARAGAAGFLSGCLALAGCGGAQSGAVRIDPALATLVPPDTTLLAGFKLDALRNTPVYRKFVAGKPLEPLDDLARQTGLDLRKDLWELLIAGNGKDTLMFARGQFSDRGLEPRLQREGIKRTPYRGYTLIGNDAGAVVFMNSSTAVAGRPAAVRAILDQRGNGGIPAALRTMLSSVSPQNQLWIVAGGPFSQLAQAVPRSGNLANLNRVLSMVESFTAAADLRSGVNAFTRGACRTDQDAKSLGDALRGLIGIGRLSTPENQPELLRVYDGIQVAQQQREIRLNVSISEDLLEKVVAGWQAVIPGGRH